MVFDKIMIEMSAINIPEGFKMTEIGLLPEDWEVIKFVDSMDKERRPIPDPILKRDYKQIGKYPIIDQSMNFIAGHTDDESKVLKNPLPIIIFGDHTRIFKYIDFPFAIGADGTKLIFPKTDTLEPGFFYFYLLSLDIPSKGYNRHFKFLKEKEIPLPPLHEQQKIASVLSTIQEAKEKTENIIRATKELKKSMMKHLFTYGPVPVEDAEKVPLKETEIGMIPEHWKVLRLEEVAEIIYGVQAAVAHLTDASIGIPILTNINIKNEGYIDLSTLRYYNLPESKRDKLILKKEMFFSTGGVEVNHRLARQHFLIWMVTIPFHHLFYDSELTIKSIIFFLSIICIA